MRPYAATVIHQAPGVLTLLNATWSAVVVCRHMTLRLTIAANLATMNLQRLGRLLWNTADQPQTTFSRPC